MRQSVKLAVQPVQFFDSPMNFCFVFIVRGWKVDEKINYFTNLEN